MDHLLIRQLFYHLNYYGYDNRPELHRLGGLLFNHFTLDCREYPKRSRAATPQARLRVTFHAAIAHDSIFKCGLIFYSLIMYL